jgi:DNA-binding CsgD family transcriptional regulator
MAHPRHITRREHDMIQGVIAAKRNKEIASDLGISENTVKVYLFKLCNKLGILDGRSALANWGRAYAESVKRTEERYRELFPEAAIEPRPPEFEHTQVAEYDVFKAMAQTLEFTPAQVAETIAALAQSLTADQLLQTLNAMRHSRTRAVESPFARLLVHHGSLSDFLLHLAMRLEQVDAPLTLEEERHFARELRDYAMWALNCPHKDTGCIPTKLKG